MKMTNAIKMRKILAISFYVSFVAFAILLSAEIFVPSTIWMIIFIFMTITFASGLLMDLTICREKKSGNLLLRLKGEIKKILKEICKFIPVWILSIIVSTIMTVFFGEPNNQTSVESTAQSSAITSVIMMLLIVGPFIEEYIFRFLPYKFIKNEVLYILISSIVFSAFHVFGDTSPLLHIWMYAIRSFYYGYRYYKTQDIWVTIALHGFNNLIAVLLMI